MGSCSAQTHVHTLLLYVQFFYCRMHHVSIVSNKNEHGIDDACGSLFLRLLTFGWIVPPGDGVKAVNASGLDPCLFYVIWSYWNMARQSIFYIYIYFCHHQ